MGSGESTSAPQPAVTAAGAASVPRLYGVVIQDDRICPGCSYNLKGMRTGDRCPECATPIPMKVGSRHGWMMTQSPVEYLRALSHGCIWMLAGGAVLTGSLIWIGVELWWWNNFTRPVGGFAVIAAVAWVVGVFMVTGPRPQEPGNPGTRVAEWRRLRWAARLSQVAWILGAAIVLNAGWDVASAATTVAAMRFSPPVSAMGPPISSEAATLFARGSVFLGIGALGLIPLAFYLAFLADWADDGPLARKLRMTPAALLGAVLLVGLLILIRPLLHDLPILFVLIPTLAVGAGLFVLCATHFGVALVQFANVGIWARQNATTALDSGRRMSSKIVKRIVEAQAKAPASPVRSPKGHKPAKPQGVYVPGGGGAETYDLAPPSAPAAAESPVPKGLPKA